MLSHYSSPPLKILLHSFFAQSVLRHLYLIILLDSNLFPFHNPNFFLALLYLFFTLFLLLMVTFLFI